METALGPKTVASSPRNGPELAKIVSVDDRHLNAPPGFVNRGNHFGAPKLSNSPRNGPESAKTARLDDQHVSTPWGSTAMEIALGPQNGE